jgi:hypothetical protein
VDHPPSPARVSTQKIISQISTKAALESAAPHNTLIMSHPTNDAIFDALQDWDEEENWDEVDNDVKQAIEFANGL